MNCKTVYSKSITCDSINFQAALAQLLIKPSHISRRFTYDKHMGPSRRIGDPNRRTAWEWALLDHYSDRRAPTPHSPLTWKGAISIEVGWSRHLITDPHFNRGPRSVRQKRDKNLVQKQWGRREFQWLRTDDRILFLVFSFSFNQKKLC